MINRVLVWLSNELVPSFLPYNHYRWWAAKCGCNVHAADSSWLGRRLENRKKRVNQRETPLTLHRNDLEEWFKDMLLMPKRREESNASTQS